MRLSYANVASTLALVLALGGAGAYAADKIDGKDLKNESVTGKKIKNGSLTGKELADGVLTTGPAGPRGPAGPVGATPISFTVNNVLGSGNIQPLGTAGGLTLSTECTRPDTGQLYYHAYLLATSSTAAQLDSVNQQFSDSNIFVNTPTHGPVAAGSSGQLAAVSSQIGKVGTTTFSWKDGSGTYVGSIEAEITQGTGTCHFTGWILLP
jgi:hypothetical protein